jgi:hypothetical protein
MTFLLKKTGVDFARNQQTESGRKLCPNSVFVDASLQRGISTLEIKRTGSISCSRFFLVPLENQICTESLLRSFD